MNRKLEDEIIVMNVIFPRRRERLSTAVSEKHTVELLSRLEKV